LARIWLPKAQDRIDLIRSECVGKSLLDIGCLDETAFKLKPQSGFWLHEELASVSKSIVGLDNSEILKSGPIDTGFSQIRYQDVHHLRRSDFPDAEVIVMGELLEHLTDPLSVLLHITGEFPLCSIVLSTPNATGITNVLGAMLGRESNHPDHVAIYSYKTLGTLIGRIQNVRIDIKPYLTVYYEAILRNKGLKRLLIKSLNFFVNKIEKLRPLYCAGYVVIITPLSVQKSE
jgi:2-polyprenyl-3-methyl-5-hydroxy-6-metoxy-1,4-benzoquinol methylase